MLNNIIQKSMDVGFECGKHTVIEWLDKVIIECEKMDKKSIDFLELRSLLDDYLKYDEVKNEKAKSILEKLKHKKWSC